ncbi:hypothetical protein [Natronobeatus ordinarius]|nr:hypothetical protein [Natronobeatus ordinarius]
MAKTYNGMRMPETQDSILLFIATLVVGILYALAILTMAGAF